MLALVIVSGCDRGVDSKTADVRAIKSTIRSYNSLLASGYRTMDMSKLRQAAGELQAEDEYIHMASLGEGGMRLDPELLKLEFLRVSIEGTSAVVETRETWHNRQYSVATGKLVKDEEGLQYHLAWNLSKLIEGRWLVEEIRAVSVTSTVEPTVYGTITPLPREE